MQDYLFNYLQNLQGSGAKVVGVGAFWGKLIGAATDLSSNLTKFGMLAAVTGLVIAGLFFLFGQNAAQQGKSMMKWILIGIAIIAAASLIAAYVTSLFSGGGF